MCDTVVEKQSQDGQTHDDDDSVRSYFCPRDRNHNRKHVCSRSSLFIPEKRHIPISVSNFLVDVQKDYVVPWVRMCLQWYIFHVLLGRNLSIRVFSFCCLCMFLLIFLALLVFPAINSVLPYRVSVFIIKFFNNKLQSHWLVLKLFKLIKILKNFGY